MNRLPYATTILSVILAIALWAVATWLQDDSIWDVPEAPSTPDINAARVRPDSEVRTIADAISCDQAESALRDKVDNAQACVSDADCTIFDYGYPIQCLTSVATNQISALRAAYDSYQQSCPYRVYYDCPTGHMERQAVCRASQCVVVLQSTEILEEETRDYLGLGQQ